MNMSWLPLTDYSTKYKVSVSTLRRRIKTDDIKFQFQEGKYLILDEPPTGSHSRVNRPSPYSESAPGGPVGTASAKMMEQPATIEAPGKKEEPILLAANKLLNELKRAYTQVLQEKEEQILQLKEEVSDLKTLVRVLESEHSRAQHRN